MIEKKDCQTIILISCLCFLVCPLLGVFVQFFFVMSYQKDKRLMYVFFALLALYFGLINSSKIPESDQLKYMDAYKLVPQRTLWENLIGIYGRNNVATTKEMGYGLMNLIGYYLTFGSYPWFITMFTFMIYMLYYDSLYKWFNYLKVENPKLYIISAVVVLTFFTQFFNLTIHLQRQMIATAVIIYALLLTIIKNKVPWWIMIFGCLLHTSVGLFIPLFIIYHFSNKLTVKGIIIIIGILALSMSVLNYISHAILSDLRIEIYALERLSKMGTSREDAMDEKLVLLVNIPLVIITLKNLIHKRYRIITPNETMLFLFYLFNAVFCIFNPDNTMQYRYFMMSYCYIPFILPLLFRKMTLLNKIYLFLIPTFFFIRFYATFEEITFHYAPIDEVLLGNIFSLYNYNNI